MIDCECVLVFFLSLINKKKSAKVGEWGVFLFARCGCFNNTIDDRSSINSSSHDVSASIFSVMDQQSKSLMWVHQGLMDVHRGSINLEANLELAMAMGDDGEGSQQLRLVSCSSRLSRDPGPASEGEDRGTHAPLVLHVFQAKSNYQSSHSVLQVKVYLIALPSDMG